jgi:purine-nucleoside phosphorylase
MTSQVSFTADNELKKKALEKAKREGISLKTVLLYSMKAYVEGKIQFGVLTEDEQSVEEISFNDTQIQEKAAKLAKLLQ